MTHTPGPWTVNKYRSIGAGEHGTRPIVAHVEPFYGTDRQYGDDTANARLIAAAPDMLAALCLAQDTLTPPRGDEEQEALAAITAAIAKALLHQGEARDVTDAMVAAERLARGEAHG